MFRADGGDGSKDVGDFLPAAVMLHACAIVDYENKIIFLEEGCEGVVVIILCKCSLAVPFP